jgi:hypothetical protein
MSKKDDQEYAIKLICLYIQKLTKAVIALNRGDYNHAEIKKFIKDVNEAL